MTQHNHLNIVYQEIRLVTRYRNITFCTLLNILFILGMNTMCPIKIIYESQKRYCQKTNYLTGTNVLEVIFRNEIEKSNYIKKSHGTVTSDSSLNEFSNEGRYASDEEDETFKIFTPGKDMWFFKCAITRYVKHTLFPYTIISRPQLFLLKYLSILLYK